MKFGLVITKITSLLLLVSLAGGLFVSSASGESMQNNSPQPDSEHWLPVTAILQNNLKAVRAEGAASSVQSTDKTLQISEAGHTLTGRYRAASDGFMRIDVFANGNRVFSEGKDPVGVWEWPADETAPENVHHDGVGALEHGVEFHLFPLAGLNERGHQIELVDREWIRGNWYYVLKIILKDGFETFRFVNSETWLVDISRDFRAFHPGIDATKKHIETRYDQWQQTNGIVHPTRSRNYDLETGELIATTSVLTSKYNIPFSQLDLARSYVPDEPHTRE